MVYRVKTHDKLSNPQQVSLPGSKSITNRVLIISSLCENSTTLTNFLFSDDTLYMAKALKQIGFSIELDEKEKTCRVSSKTGLSSKLDLYIGNSGTTIRFLASFLNILKGEFRLDGEERMRERPIQDLISALQQLGSDISSEKNNGCPPLIINSTGNFVGGECSIIGKNSSQYISSIILTAPYAKNGVILNIADEPSSKPYIDMTISMLEQFGVKIKREDYSKFTIPASKYTSPTSYNIEPDASAASYFLAITAILGGEVEIMGLGKNSIQGDTCFADVLGDMGCTIQWRPDSVRLISNGKLSGINIDMNHIPDTALTLAVVALFADSPTRISNVANLRIKETDRLAALATELTKLGAKVNELDDGLEIFPHATYHSATIATYNDHRMAMSFAIAGLKIDGVEIADPECVSKTFPDFFEYFDRMMRNST